jgi:hypothetical protein
MTLTKFASMTIVAVLALWASSAKAQPAVFQFEKMNFSLTVEQQGLDNSETSPNVYVSTIKTSKIVNKDLLSFLATAFNTNWPAGAQLAIEINSGDIFVVDKTGTNFVADVSNPGLGETSFGYFSLGSTHTVFSGKVVSKPNGESQTRASSGKIRFHLFYEENDITNTDLYFDGLGASKISRKIVDTTETMTRQDKIPVTGDGIFDGTWTLLKGMVTGAGKWKGPLPPG